jgi:C1A family cysteine protease
MSLLQSANITPTDFPTANIPAQYDWTTYGFVTPVKREGQCGASYIFASLSAIESRLMIKMNKTLSSMSEQMILNCLPEEKAYRNSKCDGGTEVEVFRHAVTDGVCYQRSEETFYTEQVDMCYDVIKDDFNIVAFGQVKPGNTSVLKAAIRRSPVTAVLDSEVIQVLGRVAVPENFTVDSKMIGCNSGNAGSVVVLLVGYDKDTFIAKGSWGTNIGNKGYFKIKIDS